MRGLRLLLAPIAAAGALLGVSGLPAQTSAIAPRIVQAVDESNLVTLKGNVTALARPQFDRGEADSAMQLTSVRLVLSRSPEQEAALEQFMAQQLDKSSPNYHHWLTPQEFGKLYGPADSDIAAIIAWLESHGFKVEPVSPGRNNIAFSGSVSQIEEAFHTSIHQFNANGREFYSNISDPKIPAALASVVSGVAHLNTLEPRSHIIHGPSGTYDPSTKRFVPMNQPETRPRPELTNGSGASEFLYVVAGDAATIYDTPNTLNANFSSGSSYTGTGVTIGIGGDGLIQASTVQNYRAKFIGDSAAPTITNIGSTATANGDTDEAYLDNEVAGALAPGAAIHFYVASSLETAIEQALTDNTVDIFSLSFGECELNLTTAGNVLINGWWQQAAAQGIAVTVSSGDSGSAGCDDDNTAQTAVTGLQVSGYASTPYNIAVGGTDSYGLLSGFSSYVSATNGNLYRSVLKYIPEATWNDSTESNGLLANNVTYVNPSTSKTNIVGGSGGVSACSSNTTTINGNTINPGSCTSGYARPSWQRGTGVPSGSTRVLPDVSLLAGNGFDYAAWLVCTDDTGTQSGTTYTDNCSGTQWSAAGFGGTSASAPAFAGILALVQQKMGGGGTAHRLGADGAKSLYDLFNGAHASAIFHDVTQGNISVPCVSTPSLSPNCTKNTAGYYFLTGYDTTTGYDLATGLGSVDVTQLVNYWGAATGTGSSTVTVTPSATTISTAQSLTVNVTVAGSGSLGTPTGTVTLSSGSYTSSAAALSAGAASITVPAGSLAVGSDTLTVSYSGDSNYASTTGTAKVTVTAVALLTPTVTITPASTSIDSSQSLSVSVKVTGTGATPTGTVTVSGGGYTGTAMTLSSGSTAVTIPANTFTSGAVTLTAAYSGDSTYTAGTTTTQITVTQSVYSVSPTAPSAISPGGTATSTLTISTSSSYSGTISLSCAQTAGPSNASGDAPSCSASPSSITLGGSSGTSATATVSITTTAASAQMQKPRIGGWMAGSGTALALLVFFGIPARRKSWRAMLGMLALLIAFAGFSACGGGGGSSGSGGGGSGGGTPSNPGTAAGAYTFTVTGTGTPSVSPAPTATISLTIN